MFILPKLRRYYVVCIILALIPLLYKMLVKKRKHMPTDIRNHVLPVLVIACNRPTVKRCLESIIRYRPDNHTFPIIVSQDCGHEETNEVIKSFVDQDSTFTLVQQPDQSDIPRHADVYEHLKGYYRIARHYKFALNYVFRTLQHKAVIIIEDDLEISSDFFEYFFGTYPLLYKDPSIWCVSAWNDNCKPGLVERKHPELLHRTDFFPGLGWMMLSRTWDELEPKWPEAYFDDWLRNPKISRGRVCIRPEISRTYNFGRYGVSNTIGFDKHLRQTILNKKYVPFTRYNLLYLLKKNEHLFFSFVYSLPIVTGQEAAEGTFNTSWNYVQVPYTNIRTFKKAAGMLGLMDDLRHGVPRTGLGGIVQCYTKGRRVFLTPTRLKRKKTLPLRKLAPLAQMRKHAASVQR